MFSSNTFAQELKAELIGLAIASAIGGAYTVFTTERTIDTGTNEVVIDPDEMLIKFVETSIFAILPAMLVTNRLITPAPLFEQKLGRLLPKVLYSKK